MKTRAIILDIVCGLFILLFTYAAVSKLLDVEKFRVQIGQSPLLTSMAGFVAWFIPAVEILISIMLAIGRTRLLGLFASFGLMVMFTAYIVAITQFSEHVPCSCGGVLQKLGWTEHLIFNSGFVVLAAVAVILHTGIRRPNNVATN
jgi:uncharacterized membrane protein YphA (DoxX/SURF4 family)